MRQCPQRAGLDPRAGSDDPALLVVFAAGPAAAHHVGAYVPRDNEVSANFKQIKFAIQARKLDVAAPPLRDRPAPRRDAGAGRPDPAGLEDRTRAALAAGDGPRAERGLMIFFAGLVRDLALEADRRLADATEAPSARVAAGAEVPGGDLALLQPGRLHGGPERSQGRGGGPSGVRRGGGRDKGPAGGGARQCRSGVEGVPARPVAAPAPEKMREPLQRIALALSGLIETSTAGTR